MYENLAYDFASNGEAWLLSVLANNRPKTVFDVGANIGHWTSAAKAHFPDAHIHAFELVPTTARELTLRFARDPAVTINAFGLLDSEGDVDVKHYPARPTLSGVTDYPHKEEFEWLKARVTTGSSYCADKALGSVDVLKIDAEGADHLVLAGFSSMLEAGRIDVVQFEYGRASITNHFLLADFYSFFARHDMTVGKLFPNYVDFRQYDIQRDEDFLGPNYVAVRRERSDLVALLQ